MKSIWSEEEIKNVAEVRGLPETSEAVVIGGGIVGILCAYFLKESGIPVIVLEEKEIFSGQTKNTTAKITSQHGLIYEKMEREFGEATAVKFGQMNQRAIDEFERMIAAKRIDCEFKRLPSYLYTTTQEGAELLERERRAAKRAGIRASIVHETELPFPITAALKYEDQAQFHPLKFLKIIAKELDLYEQTRVIRIKGNEVITNRGTVRVGTVVFASHFPFHNVPGFYFAKMHQERSYVLGIRVPEEEGTFHELNGMYYGIDSDGLSFRSAGDVILLGGGSHRTGAEQGQDPHDVLRKEAERFWPDYEEVASWSAQDCMTLDSLPYVGRFSKWKPNWYVVTGFEKWGMTRSMAAAMIIRDQLLGRNNPYEEMVTPQRRLSGEAWKALMAETGVTMKNFLTVQGPRCPHLGCRLVWNRCEKTWDCPCHGSRFRMDTGVLDNPAQTGMKNKKEDSRRNPLDE